MTVRAPMATLDPAPAPERAQPRAPTGAAEPFTSRQVLVLVGLTLLAAGLRLLHLGEWSLWVDEAHTWRDVTMPLAGETGFLASGRGRYPLSYFLLRFLLDTGLLPQTGEGWLRLPFAFAGIVTVPLLALLGARVVGRGPALLAALFLAVNPWHIYWSQNARAYVFIALCAVLAAGLFYAGHLRRSRIWMCGGLAVAVIAGLFHPTAFLLLGALPCFALVMRAARFQGWSLAVFVVLMAAGFYLLPLLFEVIPAASDFARAKPDASFLHLVHTTGFYFRVPVLIAAVAGAWLLFATRERARAWFLTCWGFLPLLVLAVVGSTVVKVTARYAFCSLPAVLLLAGLACHRIGGLLAREWGSSRASGRLLLAAMLPAILALDMAAYDYLYYTQQQGDRPMWRDAARFATRHVGDNGRLSVLTTNAPSMNYYLRPAYYGLEADEQYVYEDREVLPIVEWEIEEAGGGAQYLDSRIRQADRQGRTLFVVLTEPELREIDRDGSFEEHLRENFRQERRYPVWVGPKDQTVLVYRWVRPR